MPDEHDDYLPTFATVEEERQHRKQRLAAAYRLFGRFGLDEGAAGHITVRDPEHLERFWVNRLGQNFSHIRASDLLCVDERGEVVEGDGPLNEAAFAVHSQIHQARPDVTAAAHSHSTWGKAWSATASLLDPLTQDACMFYDDHAVFDEYSGVVYSLDAGKRIAATLADHKALILVNHGLLTVGHSVDEAAYWFITMERSCQVQIALEQTGRALRLIDPETARLTASQVGTHRVGWLAFQVLYDEIVALEPDFLN
jgi:ribulose-5-phosphate 4-epimerase/fuculose-1-phosphate aldolase